MWYTVVYLQLLVSCKNVPISKKKPTSNGLKFKKSLKTGTHSSPSDKTLLWWTGAVSWEPQLSQSPPALDVISCVQQHMVIYSCQGRQRQHTDLAVSPSPDLVTGISYLRLCMYHRHLDSFKASWRQYFFARPTRHDSARSWLLRLLESRLTNFPNRFQWPWVTPNPIFNGTPLFDVEHLRNGTRQT